MKLKGSVKILNRWNKADTTLLCAGLLFLAAVGVKNLSPDSIFAEGFLFVTEAALVGGIADWFAVTALFKKPLGFPFHTAILPNRRPDFVEASVTMVQKEFFSRRTIFKKMGDLHLLPMLTEYFEKPETRQLFLTEIFTALKKFINSQDKNSPAKSVAVTIRRAIGDIDSKKLISELGERIKKSDKDREIFEALIKRVRVTAEKPDTRIKLQGILEEYAAEKTQSSGVFSVLLAGLAQALDFVNFEEAAQIMQTQLLKFLDELSTDTPLQRKTLNECRLKIAEMSENPEFKDLVERLQLDIAASMPIESAIETALIHLENQIAVADVEEILAGKAGKRTLGTVFVEMLNEEYSRLLNLLKNDGNVKAATEKFIYELAARTALHAQPLIGSVARAALGKLTDEKLNELVYDKAEQDFVWIRMNGSVVGSVVGLILFVLIQIVGGFSPGA